MFGLLQNPTPFAAVVCYVVRVGRRQHIVRTKGLYYGNNKRVSAPVQRNHRHRTSPRFPTAQAN